MQKIYEILAFALAGILGALLRYAILWAISEYSQSAIIWGVFIVNTLGCFGFGLLWPLAHSRKVLLIGFMGSFTTFSSYIFDLFVFISSGQWELLFANAFLQLIVGFLALRMGLYLVGTEKTHNTTKTNHF